MNQPQHENKFRQLRKNLRMNQKEFWGAVKVTQSGGSRYESNRDIPESVEALVELIHVHNLPFDIMTPKGRKQLANFIQKAQKQFNDPAS